MAKVVLMEDYADHARQLACVQDLARRADLTIITRKARSGDEVVERLRDAQVAITIRDRVMFTADVLDRLPGLKLLSVCGPRLAPHVDLEAATRNGILVAVPRPGDVPLTIHRATAEMAWALILGLFKGLVTHHNGMREGAWQNGLGLGLAGKTLGIIGLGKIGGVTAQIGVAMGMRVLAWSPRLTAARAGESGAEAVSLDALLAASDVISVHANVTPESTGLLGAAAFAKMRPGAFLVNTARAALIDEAALRAALQDGRLAGAGLDVFWEEPLPRDHWLRTQPNVLLQPHLAGFTDEGFEWLVAPAVANALAYLDGRPQDIANPELLGRGN